MFLTEEEKKGLAEYERITAEQIRRDQEYSKRQSQSSPLKDLLTALEREAIENIRAANEEIGVLSRAKGKLPGMSDSLDVSIWILQYGIEEAFEDVTRWRSYKTFAV